MYQPQWQTDQSLRFSLPKLRQTSIISKKPGFFVWTIENFDKLQLPQNLIFFAEISHMFSTDWCLQKHVQDFFCLV